MSKKTWATLDGSDAIRERLDALEDAGINVADDAIIRFAEGFENPLDGVIVEVEIDRLGLYYANACWQDEVSDGQSSLAMRREAELTYQRG